MSDGRRNSVDIPLSKTLVALKRVRSLRDPATNSMSKFTGLMENASWEVSSPNNGYLLTNPDVRENEDHESNSEIDHNFKMHNHSRIVHSRKPCAVKVRGLRPPRSRLIHESSRQRSRKSVDSNLVPKSPNRSEEEVDSYGENDLELAMLAANKTNCTTRYRPTTMLRDAEVSRVGTPCLSVVDVRPNCSTDEVDVVDSSYSGCGLSYCWSRTPKYRNSNLSSDNEEQEHPLLSSSHASPYVETPRSLSLKHRPRTFNDLVGQNVIAQSLLNAISKGKIASIYLFHGPRGTGKTSAARIFAAGLNCLSPEAHGPCGFCQECLFLFSGRNRDVKELDAAKLNRKDRITSLRKSASTVPSSSRFKVFIVDDCECLHGDTWMAILSGVDEFSRHSVFVMITSDLDKLPRSSLSQCQKYHFTKIKEGDIVQRLQKICVEEGLDFDSDALNFVAAKTNGSLRDAETMLEQLGLLGKKITLSLAHELVGVVSDEELLDLLDLALSSDTGNTVRKARELMKSKVDPMQLVSQLANLIMDILAGRSRISEDVTDSDMQKLRHALKILSDTEKQLRTSKNQATWLTVALLQFNTVDASCPRMSDYRDYGLLGTNSSRGSLKNYTCYACNRSRSDCSGRFCDSEKFEAIWKRTLGNCQSNSFRSFLQKEGCLSSIYVTEGMAIAEVEFRQPYHVIKAEKSWNIIASALQQVLGCDVEIRISQVPGSCMRKRVTVKKPSFNLLSCSGRNQDVSEAPISDEKFLEACTPCQMQHFSPTAQNIEVDSRSTGTTISKRSVHDDQISGLKRENDSFKEVREECKYMNIPEPESQPSCFPKTLKLQKKLLSSDVAHTICLRVQPNNRLELAIPDSASFDTFVCKSDPYVFCSRSTEQVTCSSGNENGRRKDSGLASRLLCWRAPKPLNKKGWHQKQLQSGMRAEWVDPTVHVF